MCNLCHDGAAHRYLFSDIARRCPRRVQRRNSFECERSPDIRSARYYAGVVGLSPVAGGRMIMAPEFSGAGRVCPLSSERDI